jgi:hypothetical protein
MTYKNEVSILAIFKNEESFLHEWINHYICHGIDHIYLLNDQSTDNSVDIVMGHPYKDKITLLHTSLQDLYDREWRQADMYNKYYKYILTETKWLGIFDLDEFCYSEQETDIKKIIRHYDRTKYQELIIDWYWFGSNGFMDQPKTITHSFTKRCRNLSKVIAKNYFINDRLDTIGYHYEWCCKSFAKTALISSISHHYNKFYAYGKTNYVSLGKDHNFSMNISDYNIMFINHYLGSYNYYMNNKVSRGSCNNNEKLAINKSKIYNIINCDEIEDLALSQQNIILNI